MPETINFTVGAFVENGPRISFSDQIEIDAYDKFEVEITEGQSKTIQLIPADTSTVKCLVIQSDHYDETITYLVNGAGSPIVLDTLQNYFGEGAVSALDHDSPPSNLVVSNNSANNIHLQILVGRNATS